MRVLIIILLGIFSWHTLAAQKSPYHIRNYRTNEYNGFNQTWQVLQDQHGLIFLASTSNIFSYDGVRWKTIPVKRGAATRQIVYDSTSATIYVGAVQDFGCLEKDSVGQFVYRSFMDQLKPEETVFSDIWKIQQIGNRIYFQSAEHIFIVEGKKVIGRIDPAEGSTFALMFNCAGRLFVRQRGVGLMEINGATMSLVKNSEAFATTRLMGMLQLDPNTNLLLTGDQGFVRMNNSKSANPSFDFFPVANDTFLLNAGVLGIEWINDHEFGIFSRHGLMIYTSDFKPKVLFNKKGGLLDETISEIFVDREKNIWIAHNNGCSMISYSVPALFYNEGCGFSGTLEVLELAGDTLFLGSSEGAFRSVDYNTPGKSLHFEQIKGIGTEAWAIMATGPSALISSSTGVYEVTGDQTTQVSPYYTNAAIWIDSNQTLLTGEKGGFSVFTVDEKRNWSEARHFELPATELIRISKPLPEPGNPDVYHFTAITRFKTAMMITFNYKDSLLHIREYGPENGLLQDDCFPMQFGDSVYLFSYLTAYRYIPSKDKNDSSQCFSPAPDIYNKVYSGETGRLGADVNFRLFLEKPWLSPTTAFFGRHGNKIISENILLGNLFINHNIQFGTVQEPSTVWLLNQESVIRYDLNTPIDTSLVFEALITHVAFAGDSVGVYYPEKEITVPYKQNSLLIRFAAPYFMYDMGSVYRYQLLGYDTAWSDKTRLPEKEYTNLPEGTYTFVVQSANPFGMGSKEARFTFTILPPWYRTGLAYTGYVIAFVLLLYGTVRVSARRLRKQKEKLELIVTERTAEVVNQKQQIEAQKIDLEEAYTGIQDSIHYAQRIQEAMLPTKEEVIRIIPDSFVLFHPRDIVSGDFYWFVEKNDLVFIACVDCTGHGVPGALMSMIGNTILNQLVLEKNSTSPDKILDQLHIGVRRALKQDAGGETHDGMDIALCVLDRSTRQLHYAGANRPLWIVRNNELIETKANKFPIAGDQPEEDRRFTLHTLQLVAGDCIYLSTDGYADQFGGDRGKKFMVKRFHQLLVQNHMRPMNEQKQILDEAFVSWKMNLEQVDDVLVIGFRIS